MPTFASLYPASYGYPRPRRQPQVEDEPAPLPQRPRAAAPQADSAPVPPRPRRAGGMAPERKQQIIDQNLQRQQREFEQQEAGFAQADRRRRAITAAQLEVSKGVSREDDRAALLAANKAPSAIKARPAIPIVAPAPPGAQGNTGDPGPLPRPLARAVENRGMAIDAGMASPVPGEHQHQFATPGEQQNARLSLLNSPQVQAAQRQIDGENMVRNAVPTNAQFIDQDTRDIYTRGALVGLANQRFGGDLSLAQRRAEILAANEALMNSPAARQAQADRAAVAAMRPTNFAPTRPVVLGQGPLQRRMEIIANSTPEGSSLRSQVGEMRAGQDAIDRGTTLEAQREQQRLDTAAGQQHQRELELAKAGATTGTGRAADPSLTGQRQAAAELARAQAEEIKSRMSDTDQKKFELHERRLDALYDSLRVPALSKDPAQRAIAESIRRDIDALETEMAGMLDGTAGTSGKATPLPADKNSLEVGKVYTNSEGRRAKYVGDGKFEIQ